MIDKYGVGNDSYCYENSTVLINLLNLTTEVELAQAEVALTSYRLTEFKPDFENLSFAYLCTIHRHLFQDLYAWAGEIRTVDISKQSTRFCHARFIEKEAQKCFDYLERMNYLHDYDKVSFVKHLAYFFCEMNVVHPFREGNGRTLRLFCEVLALQAGYELQWKTISENAWLSANIAGYQGDLEPLITIFSKVTYVSAS